jgi:multiple sugar transport system substrate-binding protein
MNFYMLCIGLGEEPFLERELVVSDDTGRNALNMLRELIQLCDPKCLQRNPIAIWELMSTTDEAAYCPFAYGYSNYARPRYAKNAIEFGGLVSIDGHRRCRSTLGGAGLAISRSTREPEIAAQYAEFVASPDIQKGIYFEAGGQPGHRNAWTDDEVNRQSNGFFNKTLPTIDEAYMRPRFDVYPAFQDEAGLIIHKCLSSTVDTIETLDELRALLRLVCSKSMES